LKNSPFIRIEDHGSASKTCRIRVSISSRWDRPELGRSLRSKQCSLSHVVNISLCFHRIHHRGSLPLAQQQSQTASSSCGGGAHHMPLLNFRLSFSADIVNVHFHGASWIRDVELTLCKKHERESMISIISDFDSVYQIRRRLGSNMNGHPMLSSIIYHLHGSLGTIPELRLAELAQSILQFEM
jgi:hypothetical protein